MVDRAARLEWLKALRASVLDAMELTEAGLHFVSGAGDEHLRDAAEAWLERHRSFAATLERRIRIDEGRIFDD